MVVHAAAHLFADGDLAGGLRNLWDIDRLVREFSADARISGRRLDERAQRHDLLAAVSRARCASPGSTERRSTRGWPDRRCADRLFERRLLARNGWGQETRSGLRFAFYVRSHWLRMPPLMLARHLWTKARKR